MLSTDEATKLVASANWYHGWEIVPGVHTGGRCRVDPKATLDFYGIPEDLTGLRALDIGAWDGAYSFELERRGASVVSVDVKDPDETGYNTAKRVLGSECEHIVASVYEFGTIQPEKMYDLVLYMGVFYHLTEPMRAWEAIRGVLKPDAKLYFEGLVFDCAWKSDVRLQHRRADIEAVRDLPITYFAHGEYGYDDENWYVPTTACLYSWLLDAGYDVLSMGLVEDTSRAYGVARVKG